MPRFDYVNYYSLFFDCVKSVCVKKLMRSRFFAISHRLMASLGANEGEERQI